MAIAWLTWARDASYPVYILHQTVIIVIAYFVIGRPWVPWTKYWVVLGATLVVCVLLYEFAPRRLALLRLAFGIKTHALPRAPSWADNAQKTIGIHRLRMTSLDRRTPHTNYVAQA